MEDPFSFIAEQSQISHSQLQLLNRSHFLLENLSLESNSSESDMDTSPDMTGIIICSPPKESTEEEECYQTPEEHLVIHKNEEVEIDGAGDSLLAVDLARDTDQLFSDPISSLTETEVLVPPNVKTADFDLNSEKPKNGESDTAVTDILEVNDFIAIKSSLDKGEGSQEKRLEEEAGNSDQGGRGENPLPDDGLIVSGAGENLALAQHFVSLDDLFSVDEDDLLVVAIRAGWKIPRPRHWGSQGFRRN